MLALGNRPLLRARPAIFARSRDGAAGAARKATLLTLAAAGLTIFLFGLTPVTTRIATLHVDGLAVGTFRTVGAGILVIPLLLAGRLRPPRELSNWALLVLSAASGFIVFPVLFSIGTQRTSACHAALIMATIPLFTGLFATVVERRLPRLQWGIGAAIALAAETALVTTATGHAGGTGSTMLGDALVLGACLGVATSFVAGAHLAKRIGAWAATFWAILLASIALAPWAAVDAFRVAWTEVTPWCWLALVHLAAGAGVIGFAAWFWALARGGIARVAVLQFFQPVISLAFAALLLSERLTPALALSAAAILFGVLIARSSEGRARPASATRRRRDRIAAGALTGEGRDAPGGANAAA